MYIVSMLVLKLLSKPKSNLNQKKTKIYNQSRKEQHHTDSLQSMLLPIVWFHTN